MNDVLHVQQSLYSHRGHLFTFLLHTFLAYGSMISKLGISHYIFMKVLTPTMPTLRSEVAVNVAMHHCMRVSRPQLLQDSLL